MTATTPSVFHEADCVRRQIAPGEVTPVRILKDMTTLSADWNHDSPVHTLDGESGLRLFSRNALPDGIIGEPCDEGSPSESGGRARSDACRPSRRSSGIRDALFLALTKDLSTTFSLNRILEDSSVFRLDNLATFSRPFLPNRVFTLQGRRAARGRVELTRDRT